MLSSDDESEPVNETIGSSSTSSGSSSDLKVLWRANGPVAVALNGIDFAVVRQQPKRLREPPLRQRIGGKALVKNTYRRGHRRDSAGPDKTSPGNPA